MTKFRGLLLLGSAVALAACQGATDVASPGSGVIIIPAPTPPAPPPAPTPTPTPSPTPADCPAGTTNIGTITSGTGQVLRNCQLSGVITTNLALPNVPNLVYSLNGGVRVGRDIGADGALPGGDQAILTVDPGVVVFGSTGSDFLLVERGSRLIAEGTRTRPIIFTSRQNILGTSTETSIGQWGGIVLLGRAPISRCLAPGATGGTVNCENRIEGADGLYGGATANDSSGILRFVQVRYPGFEVTPGNELNGISLGGVGTGTVVEFVQVHNSSDDGFEWFGGGVNGRHIISTGSDDDSLDTDFGYIGNNQFVLVAQRVINASSNHVIEGDTANQDALRPRSRPRFANFTFLSRNSNASNASTAVMVRGGSDFDLINGIVTASTAACFEFREQTTIAPANPAISKAGPPNVRSVAMQCTGGSAFGSAGVTTAEINGILGDAARNNLLTGANLLADVIFPGAGVAGVTVTNASAINAFFQNTTYIGAFANAQDRWFDGWACGSAATTFAPTGLALCTDVPLPR